MTAPVFVDTNIFVYARQAGEPRKQHVASQWIERLWRDQLGRTSIQVLNELNVTLTCKIHPVLSPDDSWDHISSLFAWDPQPLNAELLTRARELSRRHTLSRSVGWQIRQSGQQVFYSELLQLLELLNS